jgi:hypothetical protein
MRASVHLAGSFELEARAARQIVSNHGVFIPERPRAADVRGTINRNDWRPDGNRRMH